MEVQGAHAAHTPAKWLCSGCLSRRRFLTLSVRAFRNAGGTRPPCCIFTVDDHLVAARLRLIRTTHRAAGRLLPAPDGGRSAAPSVEVPPPRRAAPVVHRR